MPVANDGIASVAGGGHKVATTATTARADVVSTGDASRRDAVLAALAQHLDADRATNLGFPSTFDFTYKPLWPFFDRVLNNVGDPFETSAFPANTKHLEREVVDWFARLLRAHEQWWGVCTTGGTQGIEYGLVHGRTRYPDALVVYSAASHYAVPKLITKLRMQSVVIRAGRDGLLDYTDFRDILRHHRERPIVVVATVGTTMTEAVDDVTTIRKILAEVPIQRAYIHVDAALSGVPLALLVPNARPGFDFADGADSISISGHKFLGCPFPCGVYIQASHASSGSRVDYIATTDTTLCGSRSGHAPLLLWWAINSHGEEGLRQRAERSRQVAVHAVGRLQGIGWQSWRHPHAFTVVLDTPPEPIVGRFRLASSDGQSHIITMPGITVEHVDQLVDALAALGDSGSAQQVARIPTPRPPYPMNQHRTALDQERS